VKRAPDQICFFCALMVRKTESRCWSDPVRVLHRCTDRSARPSVHHHTRQGYLLGIFLGAVAIYPKLAAPAHSRFPHERWYPCAAIGRVVSRCGRRIGAVASAAVTLTNKGLILGLILAGARAALLAKRTITDSGTEP
jgi:hypothetical protein